MTTSPNAAQPGRVSDVNAGAQNNGHTGIGDVADVRQLESGLLHLLDEFHAGRLRAFERDAFTRMDEVRVQQERLAKAHFELDAQHALSNVDTAEGKHELRADMDKIMANLHGLSTTIQGLQQTSVRATQPQEKVDSQKQPQSALKKAR